MAVYNKGFYNSQVDGSVRSAQIMVPKILSLTGAKSVVDVGCGTGSWLRAFMDNGVEDVHGFDGKWVKKSTLKIPQKNFTKVDLTNPPAPPRRFDLAMTLEVAEHFDHQYADGFVGFLTGLSDVVVWGAAIPYQGGLHHVNEQWPDYWRPMFESRGYTSLDPFRPEYWDNLDVEWWYAQNTLLMVHEREMSRFNHLPRTGTVPNFPERLIHPRMVSNKSQMIDFPSIGYVVKRFPGALGRALGGKPRA